MLVPRTPAQTGPGFSETVPSPKQLERFARSTPSDAERMSQPGSLGLDFGPSGVTSPLTAHATTPKPEEHGATGTAPSVTRTLSGRRKEPDLTSVASGARTSWGRLALVAIPLGTVLGLTMNAFTPRPAPDEPAAASMAPSAAPVEQAAVTASRPAPPLAPLPVAGEAPAPAPSVAPLSSTTLAPRPVANREPSRKRPIPNASTSTTAPVPTPPPASASVKSDIDRMRERARRFEVEARSGTAGKSGAP